MPDTATAPATLATPVAPSPTPPPAPTLPSPTSGIPVTSQARFRNSETGKKTMSGLRALAKPPPEGTDTPPATPPIAAGEPPKPAATPPTAPKDAPEVPKPPTPPADLSKPATPPAGAKPKESPWRLVETYKAKALKLEQELADFQKKAGDPKQVEAISQRAEAAERRLQELESEMRYHNYAKTTEFKEKYQEPYEKAWAKAVSEVKQLVVTGEDGQSRPATADDLWRIITQPLGSATALAKELFGNDLGNYVMAHHYGKVRDLAEAQQEALDKARKEGNDREVQSIQASTRTRAEVLDLFEQTRQEALAKLDFLKEKEGDDDWNTALAKATDYVDSTMKASVLDPKLSKEERAKLVQRHVAVRNRAIGYAMLKLETKRLKAELAERDAKLASYEKAQPGGGEGRPAEGGPGTAAAGGIAGAKARIRALARPGL